MAGSSGWPGRRKCRLIGADAGSCEPFGSAAFLARATACGYPHARAPACRCHRHSMERDSSCRVPMPGFRAAREPGASPDPSMGTRHRRKGMRPGSWDSAGDNRGDHRGWRSSTAPGCHSGSRVAGPAAWPRPLATPDISVAGKPLLAVGTLGPRRIARPGRQPMPMPRTGLHRVRFARPVRGFRAAARRARGCGLRAAAGRRRRPAPAGRSPLRRGCVRPPPARSLPSVRCAIPNRAP